MSSITHPGRGLVVANRCDVAVSLPRQAELEAVLKKTEGDRAEHQRKLERQARLLDARAAKIHKLEGPSACLSVYVLPLCLSYLSVS